MIQEVVKTKVNKELKPVLLKVILLISINLDILEAL